jgi:hypothetical protein
VFVKGQGYVRLSNAEVKDRIEIAQADHLGVFTVGDDK